MFAYFFNNKKKILRDTTLAQNFDVNQLVDITNGLTGSDLHELCRNAAMIPMRELMRKHDPSTLEYDISVSNAVI